MPELPDLRVLLTLQSSLIPWQCPPALLAARAVLVGPGGGFTPERTRAESGQSIPQVSRGVAEQPAALVQNTSWSNEGWCVFDRQLCPL